MDDLRNEIEGIKAALAQLKSVVYKETGDLHAQDFLMQSRIKELQEEVLKLEAKLDD